MCLRGAMDGDVKVAADPASSTSSSTRSWKQEDTTILVVGGSLRCGVRNNTVEYILQ